MTDIWDANEPTVQPALRLGRTWRPLEGFGFGLREPVILGQMRLRLPETIDFAKLDTRIERYIKEKPPEAGTDESDALKLVRRTLFWIGALQRQAQIPVFSEPYVNGPLRRGEEGDSYRIALPYFSPQAAMAALQWVTAAIHNFLVTGRLRTVPVEQARKQFVELSKVLHKYRPGGVNPYRILISAHDLDVPARQFMPGVLAVGLGARTRWLQSSFTDRTSMLASRFAGNKFLTAQVLRRAGLPAPTHALVKSPEEAVKIANQLGYPVVVKPSDRQQGRGVAANLNSDAAVTAAYADAIKVSKNILVEKHFEGTDFRMSVLDGKIFRVSARLPGGVTGDGVNSIAQLVEIQQQSETQQRKLRERGHMLMELDGEAMQLLSEAGLTPETVLPAGQYQRLRRKGNVSAGGTPRSIDPNDVHPDNIRLAERAVSALRLDLGGVDLILPDISRSWLETGGLICEVNAQPQLGPRNMPDLLSRMLGGNGRIPVLIIIGNGDGLDRQRLQADGPETGFASVDGVWLGTEKISGPQRNGFIAGQMLLNNPQTEAAIIVISPAEAVRFGLPVDRCDLLVLQSPDNWEPTVREALSDLLEIALPHARKSIYLQPAHSLLGSHRAAGRLEPAGAESLQRICSDFVAAIGNPYPGDSAQAPSHAAAG